MLDDSEAQQSSVHESTADASNSPTAAGDAATTRQASGGKSPESPKIQPEPLSSGTRIVRDDTDVGGPLVIKSDDPDLNPPQVLIDPFPTDGPAIDPPANER